MAKKAKAPEVQTEEVKAGQGVVYRPPQHL